MYQRHATPSAHLRMLTLLLALLALAGGAWAELDERSAAALDAAIASDERSDKDRARDRNRRPKATLEFFGFKDNMDVAEIFPGPGGWYSKILAPALAERGQLYVISGLYKVYDYGDALSNVETLTGKDKIKTISVADKLTVGADGSVDMAETNLKLRNLDLVLTFRNLHNMTPAGRMALYKAVHKSLKKGGKFGAIDHTRRHMAPDTRESGRRLDPVIVIKEATEAGFTFVDFSDLHYRADDELRFEVGRKSVRGNSDRWTLLFEK